MRGRQQTHTPASVSLQVVHTLNHWKEVYTGWSTSPGKTGLMLGLEDKRHPPLGHVVAGAHVLSRWEGVPIRGRWTGPLGLAADESKAGGTSISYPLVVCAFFLMNLNIVGQDMGSFCHSHHKSLMPHSGHKHYLFVTGKLTFQLAVAKLILTVTFFKRHPVLPTIDRLN